MCGENIRRTQLPQTECGEPLAHVHTPLERLSLGHTGEETTSECVSSSGGVYNLILADLVDWESLHTTLTLHSDDGRVSALGNDSDTLPLRVLLRQVSEVGSDLRDRVGVQVVRVGVGLSLGLVSDDVVPVRSRLVKGFLEELRNEWCGEGQDEWLEPADRQHVFRPIEVGPCQLLGGLTLFLVAASSQSAMIESTLTVKWYPPTNNALLFSTKLQFSFKCSSL